MLKRFRSFAIMVIIVAVINFAISLLLGCSDNIYGPTRTIGNTRNDSTAHVNTIELYRTPAPQYPFTGFWIDENRCLAISEIAEIVVLETESETIPVIVTPVEGKTIFALVVTPEHILKVWYSDSEITIAPYKGKFALSTLGTWKRR